MSTLRVNNMTNVGGDGPTYVKGSVIQVVNYTTSTSSNTTSTSWVDGGLSATITPKSTNSKILVIISQVMEVSASGNAGYATVFRGTVAAGTNIGGTTYGITGVYSSSGGDSVWPCEIHIYDSPNTTSATTYSCAYRVTASVARLGWSGTDMNRTITLMEIAG